MQKMKYKHYLFGKSMLRTAILYVSINLIIFVNIIKLKSPLIGFVSSVVYIYLSSVLCGRVFARDEVSWHRIVYGFVVFITLLSLGGSVALAFYQLSTEMIILLLFCMMSALIVLNIKRFNSEAVITDVQTSSDEKLFDRKKGNEYSVLSLRNILFALYVVLVIISFILLILSRSEETYVIWNSVHPMFLPSFLMATFILVNLLFSKATSGRVKLFLVVVHSLLIHSVLVIVLNPGVGGDQMAELGKAIDIIQTGKNVPNFFEVLNISFYSPYAAFYYALRKRVYQVLVVVFAKIFWIDIYWNHIVLTPILWGVLIPFFTYKLLRLSGGRENVSVLSAFLGVSISALVWWGAYSIPDTLSIVFFCFLTYLLSKYLSSDRMTISLLFVIFVVASASFISHFKTGMISFMMVLLAFTLKRYEAIERESLKARVVLILFVGLFSFILPFSLLVLREVYPGAAYIHPSFNVGKLIATDIWALVFGAVTDFSLVELLCSEAIPFLGIVGLIYATIYAPRTRYNRSICLFLFLMEVILFVDYRLIKYGMLNVPFSAERLWIFSYLLSLPFAAVTISLLVKKIRNVTPAFSIRIPFTHTHSVSKFTVITFITCITLSCFVAVVAANAYTTHSILAPTRYEQEAILYIERNTDARHVVIGDSGLLYMAWMTLGYYGAQGRFGGYYTREPYSRMRSNPSVEVLTSEMGKTNSSVGFFVVSTRYPGYSDVVELATETFGIHAIFGDGKVYVFKYPSDERDRSIPVEVYAGSYSNSDYVMEYQLDWTQILFGQTEMHLDPNSIRVVAPDGAEVPSQFDSFQAWFDNCSSSDNWSGGDSDGDILTYTAHFTTASPEKNNLEYTALKMKGGTLEIDATKYKYIEIKWKQNYDHLVNIRTAYWYKVGNKNEGALKWAQLSTEWSVWRYDFSLPNATLDGLTIEVFDAEGDWVGDYELYIDWIRFVSDTGVVRWLCNGTANTKETYRIIYDSLENTADGNRDGLPKKLDEDGIHVKDEAKYYNFTCGWNGQTLNFIINKEATKWIGTPSGVTLSYVLNIDGINVLTADGNNRGGIGVMNSLDLASEVHVNPTNGRLVTDGPIMVEICYETNGYGSLYVRFYRSMRPRVQFHMEHSDYLVGSNQGQYLWFISTNTLDDIVYYINEDWTVDEEDFSGSEHGGNWRVQGLGLHEAHGYSVVLSSYGSTVGNYSAIYNNFGNSTLDFMFYSSGSLDDLNLMYTLSENQSKQEIKDTILEIFDPPHLGSAGLPTSLIIKTVDLLDQPLDNVAVEVRELQIKTNTDANGLAYFSVPQGQWTTVIASKKGSTNEEMVQVLATTVIRQKLNLIKTYSSVLTIWELTLIIVLVVIGCTSLLLLIRKRHRESAEVYQGATFSNTVSK